MVALGLLILVAVAVATRSTHISRVMALSDTEVVDAYERLYPEALRSGARPETGERAAGLTGKDLQPDRKRRGRCTAFGVRRQCPVPLREARDFRLLGSFGVLSPD
ncbi:hypothetical protein F0344_23770 [Streptomyces finlayi]|uniref:Uncharacterized protein n=1 Tax=Streptomyces finlayi TaxID=67296 RepID=A0A7G7BPF8_9ACTN|nr:hypothetical protein [Streptomyces finlayi]QNE77223.1 hypothetical protein F0344_23770 [Streptomyces finlayi]